MAKQSGLYHHDGTLIRDGDFKFNEDGSINLIEQVREPVVDVDENGEPKKRRKANKYFVAAVW